MVVMEAILGEVSHPPPGPSPSSAVTDLKGMIVLGLFSLSSRLNTQARPVSTLNQFRARDKESEL